MKFTSRKFLLAAFAIGSATGLVAFGLIADGVYSAIVLGALAFYNVANVAQKQVEK